MISAQDLAKVTRKMKTYAVAWVHPDRKLSTRVDTPGHNNPTWNDKFVFRVDNDFIYGETSAIMIDIYALHWFRDVHVGTVRVIVGNLIPPVQFPRQHKQHHVHLGMRFVALQIRRRSGRPQGILNIGVALLDSTKRSMPLYSQDASAVGYHHLMGETDKNNKKKDDDKSSDSQNQFLLPWNPMPELRRTKSDSSSMIGFDAVPKKTINKKKTGSMVNGSAYDKPNSKASSMITGSDIFNKGKNGKPDLTSSGSTYGALTRAKYRTNVSGGNKVKGRNKNPSSSDDGSLSKFNLGKLQFGAPKKKNLHGGGSLIAESELGPSASEVAAAMMRKKNHYAVEDSESEIMGSWSLESDMEGLQSKLERWRTEIPPGYAHSDFSSLCNSSIVGNRRVVTKHNRRSSESDGVFSCFGTICGVECSIVCGDPGDGEPSPRKESGRVKRSSSVGSFSLL